MIEILIMLIGAALIGFLLGWILQKLQRDRLQAELRFIKDKYNTLQNKADTTLLDHSDLLRQVEDLRSRKDALVQELEAAKKENEALRENVPAGDGDSSAEIARLKEDLKTVTAETEAKLKDLKDQLNSSREENKSLAEKLDNASPEIPQDGAVEEWKAKVAELEKEKADLSSQLANSAKGGDEEGLSALQEEVERLKRQNKELKDDVEDLEDKLEERSVNVSGDPKEIANLRKELAALKQEKEALEESLKASAGKPANGQSISLEQPAAALAPEDQKSRKEALLASVGKASEANKNSLTKIIGVGPFIEAKLNSIGIYTFEQISRFSDADVDHVTHLIEFFPGRIERDGWVRQANKLLNKENE